MRSPLAASAFAVCLGCTSRAEVAEQMKQALVQANEGLAIALVAAEPASYAVDPLATLEDGYRHPASGPCPSNEHDVDDPVRFWAELDYGDDGCLPRSGLVPVVLAGANGIAVDGPAVEVAYDGIALALANDVTGSASGDVTVHGEFDEQLTLVGELTITGTPDDAVETLAGAFDLVVLLGADEAWIDGTVSLAEGDVTFADVRLDYDAVLGACPKPATGTATVGDPEDALIVDYADAGGGDVIVTRGRRVSDPTDLCGFHTWVFSS